MFGGMEGVRLKVLPEADEASVVARKKEPRALLTSAAGSGT